MREDLTSHIDNRGTQRAMKGAGMLVVSLRRLNFGFWSHLGVVGNLNVIIVAVKVSFRAYANKNKNKNNICFKLDSFRVKKN